MPPNTRTGSLSPYEDDEGDDLNDFNNIPGLRFPSSIPHQAIAAPNWDDYDSDPDHYGPMEGGQERGSTRMIQPNLATRYRVLAHNHEEEISDPESSEGSDLDFDAGPTPVEEGTAHVHDHEEEEHSDSESSEGSALELHAGLAPPPEPAPELEPENESYLLYGRITHLNQQMARSRPPSPESPISSGRSAMSDRSSGDSEIGDIFASSEDAGIPIGDLRLEDIDARMESPEPQRREVMSEHRPPTVEEQAEMRRYIATNPYLARAVPFVVPSESNNSRQSDTHVPPALSSSPQASRTSDPRLAARCGAIRGPASLMLHQQPGYPEDDIGNSNACDTRPRLNAPTQIFEPRSIGAPTVRNLETLGIDTFPDSSGLEDTVRHHFKQEEAIYRQQSSQESSQFALLTSSAHNAEAGPSNWPRHGSNAQPEPQMLLQNRSLADESGQNITGPSIEYTESRNLKLQVGELSAERHNGRKHQIYLRFRLPSSSARLISVSKKIKRLRKRSPTTVVHLGGPTTTRSNIMKWEFERLGWNANDDCLVKIAAESSRNLYQAFQSLMPSMTTTTGTIRFEILLQDYAGLYEQLWSCQRILMPEGCEVQFIRNEQNPHRNCLHLSGQSNQVADAVYSFIRSMEHIDQREDKVAEQLPPQKRQRESTGSAEDRRRKKGKGRAVDQNS